MDATAPEDSTVPEVATALEDAPAADHVYEMPIDYDGLVADFVALHAGNARQRSAAWLAKKAGSVGGSEMAAIMGRNPYSSFEDVACAKAGIRGWDGGSIACWWGTMFEAVIEEFVAIDLGTTLRGTDISVPAPRGSGLEGLHANSPDGYAVVTVFLNEDGEWQLLSTDAETRAAAEGRRRRRTIVLLEFKCPYRRRPKGKVVDYYEPQIWSGLALSPIAHVGLFVDAVFRKCALWSLGPRGGYDRAYHVERENPDWEFPIAWGLTGIYAPRLDAPRASGPRPARAEISEEDVVVASAAAPIDAAYEAWLIRFKAFGFTPESPADAGPGRPFRPDPVDFGEVDKALFETMMLHLDKRRFRSAHIGPCFADGRGARLGTGRDIGRAVDELAAGAPPHHYLLGVIPWKLFEVDYAFQERWPGFLEEVAPLVRECLELAGRLRAAPNPEVVLGEHLAKKHKPAPGGPAKNNVTASDLQDLFDLLG